ncbi:MAG TPA: penicillin acylase family protein [Thermoanaerobaculia bacterium]|nr:penicillin acylase family protein [Thermoanaerobaculia bacterium]
MGTRLRFRLVPAAVAAALPFVLAACGARTADTATALPGQGDDAGKTVVYRDTWGVPHIYAPTVEAGLYAMGWTQAQDRPEQLLVNFALALGEYSKVVGEGGLQSDLRSRMWDHYGAGQRGVDKLRPELRAHAEAFVAGMNDFYREHPQDLPAWWGEREIDVAMVLAFGRLFLYNWSIDEAYEDLQRGGVEPGFDRPQRGSNQFAIAPARSATGEAILAIDPHLSWSGPSRFWEMRVHAGEWHGSGVTLAGSPYIGLGHNQHLAWAMTTGGPDTADVYELTLHAADDSKYLYDGEWRALERRDVVVEVKQDDDELQPGSHTLWFSHHGPIVAKRGNKAWAAKIAYGDLVALDPWYELNFARDYQGAVRAMESLTMFPQNVMVADTSGNIYFQRTGRVPVRPDGFDWSVPVDGSSAKSEWQGVHPASDHLQVLNPPQGYMQNCNIPPDAMMIDSPFQLATAKKDYLFSGPGYGVERAGWTNQRGARALELLAADDSVTAQEAIAYINDIAPYGVGRWIAALRAAHERHGATQSSHPHYATAIENLLSWDGRLSADSTAALQYDYFRQRLRADLGPQMHEALAAGIDDWYAVVEGREPKPIEVTDEQQRAMAQAVAAAMDELVGAHGSLEASYGDRHRVGREGESDSWPLEGGGGGQVGMTTLRSISYGRADEADHTRRGRGGQTSTQVVVLSDPPQSWIYIPLGQSDRADSPHYDDQAEKAFSPRQLKPSWWLPEDLAQHIASRTELVHAPGEAVELEAAAAQ